jgi:type I restriction enzyme S subunit
MSSDYAQTLKVGDFAKVKGGKRMPAGTALTPHKSKHPYLRIVDFKDGGIDKSNLQYVPDEVFPQIARYVISDCDLYISIVGTIGLVGAVPKELNGANLTENAAKICEIDESKVHGKYLGYFLRSEVGQAEINALTVGSTQPKLALFRIDQIAVPCPPLREQKNIAALLAALDDRITLQRETNATLEAIAQALFKSWFVDFDPVRAKLEGRAPEGMDEATARLFPDSFEESELGLVPRGWRVQSFRETIQIIGGGTPKTSNPDFWGGDIPWFSVVDAPTITDVFVVDTEKHITETGLNGSSTKLLPTGTTIISARGTVGRLALTGRPMTMNQSCYGLRGLAGDSYFTYFSTKRLVEQLKQRAHGSVFDTITQESFAGVLVCFPCESSIATFEENVEPLLLRIRENLMQAQTLATLRDTLLPRLISGQLRLPEAQAAAEEALA